MKTTKTAEPVKEKSIIKRKNTKESSANDLIKSPIAKKASGSREYKPECRSGAYAILVALLKNEIEKVCSNKKIIFSIKYRISGNEF